MQQYAVHVRYQAITAHNAQIVIIMIIIYYNVLRYVRLVHMLMIFIYNVNNVNFHARYVILHNVLVVCLPISYIMVTVIVNALLVFIPHKILTIHAQNANHYAKSVPIFKLVLNALIHIT
jgi:hypothetical protein